MSSTIYKVYYVSELCEFTSMSIICEFTSMSINYYAIVLSAIYKYWLNYNYRLYCLE